MRPRRVYSRVEEALPSCLDENAAVCGNVIELRLVEVRVLRMLCFKRQPREHLALARRHKTTKDTRERAR